MATGTGMPLVLSLRRSTQSGSKAMTAAWQDLYSESCSQAYLFSGASIDLTNLQAGDTLEVKIEKVAISGGAWVAHDQMSYSDAQPATHLICSIGSVPNVYGLRIQARQTAGVLRNLDCEFFDAKRLGF